MSVTVAIGTTLTFQDAPVLNTVDASGKVVDQVLFTIR